MNVSIYTLQVRRAIDGPGPDKLLKHYFDMGIVAGDVVESELRELSLKEYNKYITDSGMYFGAFVGLADIITAKCRELEENEARIKCYIDELDSLGVNKIMLAPTVVNAESPEEFYAMRERMVEGFGKMVDYARGSGVKVTIENQSVPQRADSRIADCKYILDQIPELGFVFDAGNFFCVEESALDAWEVLGARSVHSHMKDWEFYEFGRIVRSNMPALRSSVMGEGLVGLDKLLPKMKADGYDGSMVLEVNGRPFTTEIMDKSAEFLLSYCK